MVPMNGRNALVSAVILNWNGGDLVLRCQATLGRQTYPDLEAIVVDNGSTDGSLERLRESKPTPRVVQNQTNLGFAVAANQGIAASAGDWILLLNQDVELEPDYVARLVAAGSAETTIGSVTGKLIRLRDGTQNVIDSTGHVLHRNGWVTNRGEDSPDLGQYEQPGEVFGVTAAAALYRTCRRGGETVRKLIDCLIAATAIRSGVAVLHADADFDTLARQTELRIAT